MTKRYCPCTHPKNIHQNGVCMAYMASTSGYVKCPCSKPKHTHDLFYLSNILEGNIFFSPDPAIEEIIEWRGADE